MQHPRSDSHDLERARVLAAAKSWLGTPFHDCAAVRGAGVDCAMFIVKCYAEAGLEPPDIEKYSPQWYMTGDKDLWLDYLNVRGVEVTEAQALPADVVVYKFGSRFYSHGAFIDAPGWPSIIHAYRKTGIVLKDFGNQGLLARCPRRFFTRKAWST